MRRVSLWSCAMIVVGLLQTSGAWAVTGEGAAAEPAIGGPVQFRHPGFEVTPSLTALAASAARSLVPGVADFERQHPGRWDAAWDERGNRPNLIQGSGVPLLPGGGNRLEAADAGLAPGQPAALDVVERLLRWFVLANSGLFRVAQADLRLHPASGPAGAGGRLWLMEFEVLHGGVPIEGARVFFRINSGNIVQFGTELVGDVQISAQPAVSASRAGALALARAGVAESSVEALEPAQLKIYPELPAGDVPGERHAGAAGAGYSHRLVWELDFRRTGDHRTYRAVVDAHAGSVLELYDANRYAKASVTGGIYPGTNTDAELVVPLPDVAVTNRFVRKVTDDAGTYDYAGGWALAQLAGPLVRTKDTCGSSVLFSTTGGQLGFGKSGGTNCQTPGKGGAGNTHASRNALFHLSAIKETARGFLPGNAWLPGQLTARTNLNQTCNAFWDGTRVNFFRAGNGCSNTGEIASVLLHEFGHGLDQHTGGAAAEGGSGEAVGDITAFLETGESCIGPNFVPGVPCFNCSSTSCTGVRDAAPFSSGGAAAIAHPATVESLAGIGCGRFACGQSQLCKGPMGYECHCESYIASTAVWDLTQLLIAQHGSDEGRSLMRQLWYDSLVSTKSAYRVVSGGQCNPSATVDGCGASNWFTVLLAVDDDDGNLANGTPNGCRIWQAFNDHGIACGAQPACSP